jgi:cell division protein FtsB
LGGIEEASIGNQRKKLNWKRKEKNKFIEPKKFFCFLVFFGLTISAHLFCQMNFCSKNEVWVSPPPFSTLFHFKILTHFGKKEINSKNNLEEKNKKLFAEKKQQKRRLKN